MASESPPEVEAARRGTQDGVTWGDVLDLWDLVEADLHQVYGVEAEDQEPLWARTWRWLRARTTGLLTDPSTRIWRALAHQAEQDQ